MLPSGTVSRGLSQLVRSLFSSSTSHIRSAPSLAMVDITNTMESIITLISICIAYVIRLIRLPVERPIAGSPPQATIAFAPSHETIIIQVYEHTCISGAFHARFFSAFVKSERMLSEVSSNLSIS